MAPFLETQQLLGHFETQTLRKLDSLLRAGKASLRPGQMMVTVCREVPELSWFFSVRVWGYFLPLTCLGAAMSVTIEPVKVDESTWSELNYLISTPTPNKGGTIPASFSQMERLKCRIKTIKQVNGGTRISIQSGCFCKWPLWNLEKWCISEPISKAGIEMQNGHLYPEGEGEGGTLGEQHWHLHYRV